MSILYGARLQRGGDALGILALALPAHFVSSILIGRLIAEGRQIRWMVAAAGAGVLSAFLNLTLDVHLGMIGAASATVASEWSLMGFLLWSYRQHALSRAMFLNLACLIALVCLAALALWQFGAGLGLPGLGLIVLCFGLGAWPIVTQRVPVMMRMTH